MLLGSKLATPRGFFSGERSLPIGLLVMPSNDANGIANSEDPDQTTRDQSAPRGAVWSGTALFARTFLFENLVSLQ